MGYFILGMLMVQAFFPLIDGVTAVLLAGLEALKGYFNTDVEIMYFGNTFDERYAKDVLNYLKDKDFLLGFDKNVKIYTKEEAEVIEAKVMERVRREAEIAAYANKNKATG